MTCVRGIHSLGTWVVSSALSLMAISAQLVAQDQGAGSDAPVDIEIDVVSTAPLDSAGLPREEVPATVYSVEAENLASTVETLVRQVPSVQFNDAQHNPMQRDVTLRGFAASPLLGLPQGIAIFADGVRMNDAFGDVMNWDLLPEAAIDEIDVLPGSNPLFGLNALGGALAIRTKSGATASDPNATLSADSFGLKRFDAAAGFNRGAWHGFVTGTAGDEEGWRDFSPSRYGQLFVRGGRISGEALIDGTFTYADTKLLGNGAAPVDLLREDWSAVFTHPDVTENVSTALATWGSWLPRSDTSVEFTMHGRRVATDRLNGDDSPFEPCDERPDVLCDEHDGGVIVSQNGVAIPSWIGGAPANAVNNMSDSESDTVGATLQMRHEFSHGRFRHRLLGGTSIDSSTTRFSSGAEIATFTESRGTTGLGITAAQSLVGLDARTRLVALHLRDSMLIGDDLAVSTAIRYQISSIELDDLLGDELNGSHRFTRANGSVGISWNPAPGITLFAAAGETSRSPTAVELTCADPEDPCRLPNAFVSDPPLDQVVTRTVEVGARGTSMLIRWNAAFFDAENREDLLFIASGATQGEGYFANVGTTTRRGAEMSAASISTAGRFRWSLGYAWLDAKFDSPVEMPSANHPGAIRGEIRVPRGARIPGLAEHTFTWSASWAFSPFVTAAVHGRHQSSQYMRGDEANLLDPVDGFDVWNSNVDWQLSERFLVRFRVKNLFNERYATFGVLGDAEDVLGDDFDEPLFISPAAPRSIEVALTWRR